MTAAAITHPGAARQQAMQQTARLSRLRVSGVLAEDAHIYPTTGTPPGALLLLKLQPIRGLAYHARVDLGTDVADHMAAEAELPRLRAGVLVSLAGAALELRTDHGHAVLQVLRARDVVAFFDPIPNPAQQEA